MKQFLLALTLTFGLSIQAFGGDISTSGRPAPVPCDCAALSEPAPGDARQLAPL